MDMNAIYNTGRVRRFHTTDLPAQTIGHHSWGVALIVARIYPAPHLVPSHLFMAALTHDCAEAYTGDLPAPVLREHPELKLVMDGIERTYNKSMGIDYELTEREKHILRWADVLECFLYAEHCLGMGVMGAAIIMDNAQHYLLALGFPTSEAKEFYNELFS